MDLESGLGDLARLLASSFGPLGGDRKIQSWIPSGRLFDHQPSDFPTGADKIIETESKTILVSSSGSDLLSVLSPAYGRLSLVIKSVQVGDEIPPDMIQEGLRCA